MIISSLRLTCLLAAGLLCAGLAFAQAATPATPKPAAPQPAVTAPAPAPVLATPPTPKPGSPPAAASDTSHLLTYTDPKGKVIGKEVNPETANTLNFDGASSTPAPSGSSIVGQVLNTVLALALVLGIAYVVLLGIKKYYQGDFRGKLGQVFHRETAPSLIQVVEQTPLGPGRTLYVVRVGSRTLLLAAAGPQVQLLSDLTESAPPAPTQDARDGEAFAAQLARLITTRSDAPALPDDDTAPVTVATQPQAPPSQRPLTQDQAEQFLAQLAQAREGMPHKGGRA